MELKTALTILVRWLWLVALCAAAGGAAAAFANSRIAPEYEARAMLAVNQLSSDGSLTNYDNLLANELLAKSYAETMLSRPVLAETIARLKLETSPGLLENEVSVTLVPETQLMYLVVSDGDPQRAADTANTIVEVFREQNREQLAQRYSASRESLEAELGTVKAELEEWGAQVDWLRSLQDSSPSSAQDAATSSHLRDAEQTLGRLRNNYAAVTEALAKVRLAETQVADNIDVIEAAYPVYDPVWPDPMLNLVVATVAGALLGAFIALLVGSPRPPPRPAPGAEA